MSLPRFSVHNSVLVNMVMILIIAMGTFALVTLPRELFPQIRLNRIFIVVQYPGASPEEVEKLVTKPIEDEIKGVDHIDLFLSQSLEGISRVNVIFDPVNEEEFFRVYQDLRREVDQVDLPDGAEDPTFFSLESSTFIPMASLAISGTLPEWRMKELAEELQDEVESLAHIDSVRMGGARDREVWVEIDPEALHRYNLTLEQVAGIIGRQNTALPSGNIRVGEQEYLLRSVDEFKSLEDIAEVVLVEDRVGNHVRLRDVAGIRDTYQEPTTLSRLNGQPAISLNIYKKPEGNTLEQVEELRRLAERKKRSLPPGMDVRVVGDFTARINNSIGRLTDSAMYGGLLVLLLLLVFLGWRNAIFVLWGIPITFLLTFVFIDLYGESINESSLFGLVLVLGMIVDDAIVVMENVARHLNRGVAPRQAAIQGTQEVMWPVVASSLTTIAAFLPLALLPGTIGEWMKVIPVCVSFALVASLFESLVILPAHISDLGRADPDRHKSSVNRAIRFVASRYRRLMGLALRWRWGVLPVLFLAIAASTLVVPMVGVDLFQDDEFSMFAVRIWMPEGTHIESTSEMARRFEIAALDLPRAEVTGVMTQVGLLDTDTDRINRKNVGQVLIYLVEPDQRQRSVSQIMDELRTRTEQVKGYQRLEIATTGTGPPVGAPVEVKIKGRYLEDLGVIAEEVKAYLETLPGVFSIRDDLERGKNEVRVRVDKNRSHLLQLDSSAIARQIKYAFDGMPATVYRDGDEEIDVIVKHALPSRDSIEDVGQLKIPTLAGGWVPLSSVADLTVERGWDVVNRFDGERAVSVTADVEEGVTTPIEVTNKLQERFMEIGQRFPGYRLDFRGEFQEFENTFKGVTRLFLLGIILMYLILGAQFRSFLQPMLILCAIPFAFAGAMLCLLVNGYHFSVNVMFGMVALSGIAVNDSIVLISFINDARARGASLHRAVLTGAKRRLRPIFLTTVTTVFGLLPMATGLAGESVVWMPLASTVVWGVGVATLLILLVIPPLYAALDDIRRLIPRKSSSTLAPARPLGGAESGMPAQLRPDS